MKAVKISDYEWNYLKDDGTYLLDKNVYYCYVFKEGFGKIHYKDYTFNFVNSECELLLKTNVDTGCSFEDGFAHFKINGVLYYIDKECNFYDSNKVSFKELYCLYPNMRCLLIEIIDKYTYYNVEEYFIWKL